MHPFSADSPRVRTLAAVLREARERVGISGRELSRRMEVANSTIARWENGQIVPSADDVAKVLTCLGIESDERESILSIARDTIADDWLTSGPTGVSRQLAGVMECERTARHVTEWAPLLIPGMLQTSAYARAILARGTLPPGEAETRVMMRMARREAITRRRDPTALIALIGEPAIRGGIGGRAVMADQLRQLLDFAALDNITIQVVSVAGEWHPGHTGPFILYEFEEHRRPIVYLEHHRSGAFLVDDNDIRDFQAAVDTVRGVGMSSKDSLEFISDLVKTMEETP